MWRVGPFKQVVGMGMMSGWTLNQNEVCTKKLNRNLLENVILWYVTFIYAGEPLFNDITCIAFVYAAFICIHLTLWNCDSLAV